MGTGAGTEPGCPREAQEHGPTEIPISPIPSLRPLRSVVAFKRQTHHDSGGISGTAAAEACIIARNHPKRCWAGTVLRVCGRPPPPHSAAPSFPRLDATRSFACPSGSLTARSGRPQARFERPGGVAGFLSALPRLRSMRPHDGQWSNADTYSAGAWPSLSVNQDTNNVMISYFHMTFSF